MHANVKIIGQLSAAKNILHVFPSNKKICDFSADTLEHTHKMHWRDMGMLMEDTLKIETSFWRNLGILATNLDGSGDKDNP